MKPAPIGCKVSILLLLRCAGAASRSVSPPDAAALSPRGEASQTCQADFERAHQLVAGSYSAYFDKVAERGRAKLEAVARLAAERVRGLDAADTSCAVVLREWLGAFEDGHLFLIEAEVLSTLIGGAGPSESQVHFEQVSDSAVLLRIKSFYDPVEVANIVDENRGALESARRLMIDLRGNSGGQDEAYEPLMDFIFTRPYEVLGDDVLATADNVAAWERMIPLLPTDMAPGQRQLVTGAVARMRASLGQWVQLDADQSIVRPRVLERPEHVALFFDRGCASSCEAFLLAAIQSDKVTTFGSHSAGVIDHGNVRFETLPSGEHALAWPTSRSRRLPEHPLDGVGIAPKVRIPPSELAHLDGTAMAAWSAARR